MCGIFGYIGNKKNAAQLVLNGLKKLEYRGYDSWGIAIKANNCLLVEKHVGKIGQAHLSLNLKKFSSNFALGHTRWATHGGVTEVNAHPHLDCSGKIAIVHNGIVENYSQLKKRLIRLGHRFASETDSEIIAHLIEQYRKKFSFFEAFRLAFNQLTGLNAVIAMDRITEEFVAAKTGSPLVVGFGRGENFLASDVPALLSHTRQVHFLEDGQLVKISAKKSELFDVKTGKKKRFKIKRLNWKIEAVEKGTYPHFMIKEITEQPRVLTAISENLTNQITKIGKIIKKAYGTYFIGCGSASYAALSGTYLFSRIAHRHVNFAVASEFAYTVDFLTPKSLVVAFSQSGETIDTIESVNKAKNKEAKILAVVNNLGSTLYRLADYKILLGAGPEKCVLATKSFTAKLAVITLLAYSLKGELTQGKKIVKKAAQEIETILKPANLQRLKKLVNKIVGHQHIYVVGRGQSYPIALETALKIKEVSYIHAEGFAAGELKHGVIALIEKGTPCLVFAPNDETYGASLSGAMEMKARGGFIIGISFKPHEVFDYYLPVSDCGNGSNIASAVIGQLLGYYLCLKKGYDPDKPRNLAKSVTVK